MIEEDEQTDYENNKKILEKLNEQKKIFQGELDGILREQQKIYEELTDINLKVQQRKENLDDVLKNDEDEANEFGPELLLNECNKIVGRFIQDVNKERTLQFRIEYLKNIYSWKIENETMTFLRLKQETKLQFGKMENEFYFADENNNIYMDELNVKKALFPLSSVVVSGYIPTVRVVDKKSKILKEIEIKQKEEKFENSKNSEMPLKEKIKNFIYEKFYAFVYLFMFALFLGFYIESCILFRNSENYRNVIYSFQQGDLNFSISADKFLESHKVLVAEFFQFPTEDELNAGYTYLQDNTNVFNQNNLPLYVARYIQTRYKYETCKNIRIEFEFMHSLCRTNDYITEEWTVGGTSYQFNKDPYREQISGKIRSYDNSGYRADIPLQPQDFYNTMNKLIDAKWVDKDTINVIYILNFYNPSFDLFMSIRLLYENNQPYMEYSFTSFGLISVEPSSQHHLIAALILSIVNVGLSIFNLKFKKTKVKKEIQIKLKNLERGCCAQTSYKIKKIFSYIKKNFRKPDFFECISKCFDLK